MKLKKEQVASNESVTEDTYFHVVISGKSIPATAYQTFLFVSDSVN